MTMSPLTTAAASSRILSVKNPSMDSLLQGFVDNASPVRCTESLAVGQLAVAPSLESSVDDDEDENKVHRRPLPSKIASLLFANGNGQLMQPLKDSNGGATSDYSFPVSPDRPLVNAAAAAAIAHDDDASTAMELFEEEEEENSKSGCIMNYPESPPKPVRTVTFSPSHAPALSPDDASSLGQQSVSDPYVTIRQLRDTITSLQVDLSAEQVLRTRKERNLVKLAQELHQRAQRAQELAAQVKQLRHERHEQTQRARTIQQELQHVRSTLERGQAQHASAVQAHEQHIVQVRAQHELTCGTLRRQYWTISLERDRLASQLQLCKEIDDWKQERNMPTRTTARRLQRRCRKIATTIIVVAVFGFWLALHTNNEIASQVQHSLTTALAGTVVAAATTFHHGMCAPVRPGTVLHHGEETASAPWWWQWAGAPAYQAMAFDYVCHGHERVQLRLDNSHVLRALQPDGGLVWKRKHVQRVTVQADKLEMTVADKRNKTPTAIEMVAPWIK